MAVFGTVIGNFGTVTLGTLRHAKARASVRVSYTQGASRDPLLVSFARPQKPARSLQNQRRRARSEHKNNTHAAREPTSTPSQRARHLRCSSCAPRH